MASSVQMNYTEAQKWIEEINELNQQLDSSNKSVTTSVEDIKNSSSGSVVDGICSILQEVTQDGVTLINAFNGLVGTVTNAITAATQLATEIGDLVSGRAFFGL